MRVYLGTPGWGWRLFGIGWKDLWFFGFSMKIVEYQEVHNADSPLPQEQS